MQTEVTTKVNDHDESAQRGWNSKRTEWVGGRLIASTVSAEGSGSLDKMTGASVARAPNGTTKVACSPYVCPAHMFDHRWVCVHWTLISSWFVLQLAIYIRTMYLPRYLLTDCTSLTCGACDLHITYSYLTQSYCINTSTINQGWGKQNRWRGGANTATNLVAVLVPRSKLWGEGGKCGVTGLFSFAWKSHM